MRKLSRLVVATAVILGSVVAGPLPAHAAADITCTVSSNVTFSPGLRLAEQQTHITFQIGYSNCRSTSQPQITSAMYRGTFDGPRGCLSLPPSHPPTGTVTWNTGETSTIEGTASGYDVGGQTVHTFTGTVVDGPFASASFVEIIAQANPKLTQCLTPPGVTSQTGLGIVTVG